MTKEQVQKHLWQHNAEERKTISLIFRQRKTHEEPQKVGAPVQIHTLQIKRQEGLPTVQIQAVKSKRLAKEQAKKGLQCLNHKEQKEIALELLKGVPQERLTPTLLKLQQNRKPVVMGNLSVMNKGSISKQTKSTIACICAVSTTNLTRGHRIAQAYAKLAAEVKAQEECEVDKELARKAQNSTRTKWDHHAISKHRATIDKVISKDPEQGQEMRQAYALERQEVAHKEG